MVYGKERGRREQRASRPYAHQLGATRTLRTAARDPGSTARSVTESGLRIIAAESELRYALPTQVDTVRQLALLVNAHEKLGCVMQTQRLKLSLGCERTKK